MIALPDHIPVDDELSLHALAPEHAPALFAHIDRHRAELSPYLDWVRRTQSVADTAAFIAHVRAQAERGEAKVWAIVWQGEAVGTLSFNEIDWRGRGTAAGYWLSPALHRRGIVRRALDALLNAVADDLPHCELRCAVHNAASNALAQRCGFYLMEHLHGTETINGVTYRQNIYRRITVSARTRALQDAVKIRLEPNAYLWLDGEGKVLLAVNGDYVDDFNENGLAYRYHNEEKGFINTRGETVFVGCCGYGWFENGLLTEYQPDNYLFGFMNESGDWVIEPQFDAAAGFADNGLALIEKNGLYGYINRRGETVIAPQFDDAQPFAANGLAAVKSGGQWRYINACGETVLTVPFEYILDFNRYGLAVVIDKDRYGAINAEGKIIIPLDFDLIEDFIAENGWAAACQNGLYGYINTRGEWIIPPQFDYADSFQHGLAAVQRNGWYGFINADGETVIDCRFGDARNFAPCGLAWARQNGMCLCINTSGETVLREQAVCDGAISVLRHRNGDMILPDGSTVPADTTDAQIARLLGLQAA